ncbi:hypothetical protein TI05_06315 [Achromatium sp. WMS3]|nr:hypothetical protein TI05_06315 [Achromatium sp. WMS3]
MITKEQLKADIDVMDERHFEVIHQIMNTLMMSLAQHNSVADIGYTNPLKNSVIFEHDIVSPIDATWNLEQ